MPVTVTTARGAEPVDCPTIGVNDPPGSRIPDALAPGDVVFVGQRTLEVSAVNDNDVTASSGAVWHFGPGVLLDAGTWLGIVQFWQFRAEP